MDKVQKTSSFNCNLACHPQSIHPFLTITYASSSLSTVSMIAFIALKFTAFQSHFGVLNREIMDVNLN